MLQFPPFVPRNELLRTLSSSDLAALASHLEPIKLVRRDFLVRPHRTITSITFPESGIVSVVAVTKNGERVEIGIFGRDGMSAAVVLLSIRRLPYEVFVQGEGVGHTIQVDALLRVAGERPSLRDHLLRWQHAFAVQTAYTALANGCYTIEARLARWLLMCDDRTDGDDLSITHEFLGAMLSVRRSSVTVALNRLKGRGEIETRRGMIRIIDRPALLALAGAAYGYPEAEYLRIFGAELEGESGARANGR